MAALNGNMLFAGANRVDAATVTAGTANASFPASNLKLPELSRPWRSTNVTAPGAGRDTGATTWLECDFGKTYLVQCVALLQHNLSQGAKWRVRLSNDATWAAADVYDSGLVNAWPAMQGFGTGEWGDFTWGGVVALEDLPLYSMHAFALLPNSVSVRYLRLELSDAGNSKGFLQAARLLASPIWQPTINMDLDWSVGWEDPSVESRALGGVVTFDKRPSYRVAAFSLSHMPEAEAAANVLDYLDRRKGRTGDLLWIPQPLKPDSYVHEAIYGRQRRLDPIRNPYVDSRRARGFELEEMR